MLCLNKPMIVQKMGRNFLFFFMKPKIVRKYNFKGHVKVTKGLSKDEKRYTSSISQKHKLCRTGLLVMRGNFPQNPIKLGEGRHTNGA